MRVQVPLLAENGTPRPWFNDRVDSFGYQIRCINWKMTEAGIDVTEPHTIHYDREALVVHVSQ